MDELVSKTEVIKIMQDNWHNHNGDWAMQESMDDIRALPSVAPQYSSGLEKNSKKLEKPQTFKWCTDCKEYDQEKHCCHRWSKVIRDTVEEMKKEPRWIPTSERLPKEAYACLVTVLDANVKTQEEFENILPYFVGYDGETWNDATGEPIPFEVIAWMPLPKAYREVEE